MADVSRGTNSYYKIQLLESRGTYFVFRAWGRIGTTIGELTRMERPYATSRRSTRSHVFKLPGSNKLQEHATLQDALLEFKSVFLDKTGNEWESRKHFVKQPKHFDIIEMDLMQDEGSVDTKQVCLKRTPPRSINMIIIFLRILLGLRAKSNQNNPSLSIPDSGHEL